MLAARYLSRRIGRSQNGMADGPSWARPLLDPLLDPLPPSAGSAGGAGGLGLVAGRWRAPVPDHPVDGQAGPADPAEPFGAREPAAPDAGERPAPRDQPSVRGGRSSGGAVRAPLSASGAFLLRARPAAVAPRREPRLASPSPSAAGGASGRNRDAYASPLPA
jgi:hypothetical protein